MMRIHRRPFSPSKATEALPGTPGSKDRPSQAGFTILELIIAGALLVFGILTMAGLVGLAVKNNGYSRLDSTATMLNQAVVEQLINGINNKEIASVTSANIVDCNGGAGSTSHQIDSDGPGAPLDSRGNIDFTQAPVQYYSMSYAVCSAGRQVIYDVRWNITAPTGTAHTSILTVGSRIQGGPSIINFPINMRVMVGPDPTSETPGS